MRETILTVPIQFGNGRTVYLKEGPNRIVVYRTTPISIGERKVRMTNNQFSVVDKERRF